MSIVKHRTIPIFVPGAACPFKCIYCDQSIISGQQQMPSDQEIVQTIESHLATFPSGTQVELGFFGGTFTGLAFEEQQRLLSLVQPYLERGQIEAVRLSTRPDYITPEIVSMLKQNGVRTVELGVQSLDAQVLQQVHRGYTPEAVFAAADIIRSAGLDLGMQMMIGLPGDTPEKSFQTARQIIDSGATNTRIYPTLVIRQTALAALYAQGRYHPLTIEEAVQWTAPVLQLFEEAGVTVLRVGLHPTEGFIAGTDYIAGPFHVSFKELVQTQIWHNIFSSHLPAGEGRGSSLTIAVAPRMLNSAVGYGGSNRRWFLENHISVHFETDPTLDGYRFHVKHS